MAIKKRNVLTVKYKNGEVKTYANFYEWVKLTKQINKRKN